MISVVIPVYNRQELVVRAIESVLNQTLKASEIIVVDDGSTDRTLEVVKSYKNLEVITQKNRGVSAARNRGIEASSNEWIAFLDSDDVWHRDKLKVQYEFHQREKDILFSHTLEEWIRDNRVVKQKSRHAKPDGFCFEENLEFCKIAPSTVMINRAVFDRVGYFDEDLEVCEDYDMWLRVSKEYKIGLIDEVLTTKYSEDEQLSFKYIAMDRFRVKALIKHKNIPSVKEMIEKKLSILQRGAIKHNNSEILEFCSSIYQDL